ncbi:MAG TPA: isochorismatase family protein [Acidimicrobiales bacterium]
MSSSLFGAGIALLVIDVQNDFADPAGALAVQGGDEVVRRVNHLVGEARAARSPVFYTQDWHPADTAHFDKHGGEWPVHCVAGTWGAELHPDLLVAGPSVHKGINDGEDGYSGFSVRDPASGSAGSTGLAEQLRSDGVEQVVIAGLATDYCVKATALDAVDLGLGAIVVRDAVAAVDLEAGDGDRALDELAAAGVVLA